MWGEYGDYFHTVCSMTIGTRLAEGGDCHMSWISRSEPAKGWKLRLFAADSAVRTMEGRENIIEVEKKQIFTKRGSRVANTRDRRVNFTSTLSVLDNVSDNHETFQDRTVDRGAHGLRVDEPHKNQGRLGICLK